MDNLAFSPLLISFAVHYSNLTHHRTGGHAGFMKAKSGHLEEPDLPHSKRVIIPHAGLRTGGPA
jgi:hypothetical protein